MPVTSHAPQLLSESETVFCLFPNYGATKWLLTDCKVEGNRGKKPQFCLLQNSNFQEIPKIFVFQNAFASAGDHSTDKWTVSNHMSLLPRNQGTERPLGISQDLVLQLQVLFRFLTLIHKLILRSAIHTLKKKQTKTTHRFITQSNYVWNRASSTIFHNNPQICVLKVAAIVLDNIRTRWKKMLGK